MANKNLVEPILVNDHNQSPQIISSQDANTKNIQPLFLPEENEDDAEVVPYSFAHDLGLFFRVGIPIGCSAVLEWGVPPLFAMFMAGQTSESTDLQAGIGYGRMFYNVTILMTSLGLFVYFDTSIAGAIGAGRSDRIPNYIRRTIILVYLCMIPLYVLQFFSEPVMLWLGIHRNIAKLVGQYTPIMVGSNILLVIEAVCETVMINFELAHLAALNSFLTGALDIVLSYYMIYKWEWGIKSVALIDVLIRAARIIFWVGSFLYYKKFKSVCIPITPEPIFLRKEVRSFMNLALPSVLAQFAGWFVFEIQLILLSKIPNISKDAIAAGAIWVQIESCIAAIQTGWIAVVEMRIPQLLGKLDPGAPKSFMLLTALASFVVALTNIALYFLRFEITANISNNAEVRHWFIKILWVVCFHSQVRVAACTVGGIFAPVGKMFVNNVIEYFAFYIIGLPIPLLAVFTDWITDSTATRMKLVVSCCAIGELAYFFLASGYLWSMDWVKAAKVVNARANLDKQQSPGLPEEDNNNNLIDVMGQSPGGSPITQSPGHRRRP